MITLSYSNTGTQFNTDVSIYMNIFQTLLSNFSPLQTFEVFLQVQGHSLMTIFWWWLPSHSESLFLIRRKTQKMCLRFINYHCHLSKWKKHTRHNIIRIFFTKQVSLKICPRQDYGGRFWQTGGAGGVCQIWIISS